MKTFLSLIVAVGLPALVLPASAKSRQASQPEAQTAGPPQVTQPALPPPDDTAKFLAGMPISKSSPLAPLTADPAWQEHSAFFEKAFAKLNTRQLQKLRTWQDIYLPESRQSI